jgi:hypothetical protein
MSSTQGERPRLFVTSDPHGHLDELRTALRKAGLVGEDGAWTGGTSRLYVLGDLFDRGPDGIGVIDLLMSLQPQAQEADGEVVVILGNHEVLAVGVHLFGTQDIDVGGRQRNFAVSWMRNGGVGRDQDNLSPKHVEWLRELPAMLLVDDFLLMHADTLEYVEWGESVDEINGALSAILATDDAQQWWDVWWRLTTRYVYNGEDGAYQAEGMLERLGGRTIVHGHSIVGDLLDIESDRVTGPLLYAEDQVLAVDGGIYDGGPCLVVELPVASDDVMRRDPDPARREPTSDSTDEGPEE